MLTSPFQNSSKSSLKKAMPYLFLMLILVFIGMRFFDAPLKNNQSPAGIVSFELANDLTKSIAILDSWTVNAKVSAGMSMGLDFLFLVLYALFLALIIHKLIEKNRDNLWHKIGTILIWSVFLAALCDIIENIALIKLLLGDLEQIWSSIAYYFAIVKFAIVLICIIYLLINWLLLLFKKTTILN